MRLTDVRTGGHSMCKCGLALTYHQLEPAYYGAERFGEWTSVAERTSGCTEFRFVPEPFSDGFRRRFGMTREP
jgi:hypothetical protein